MDMKGGREEKIMDMKGGRDVDIINTEDGREDNGLMRPRSIYCLLLKRVSKPNNTKRHDVT